jgi:2-polyprenyl-6-methoxyphenol hydroxylase-like FAD-dependent oxidoreductase
MFDAVVVGARCAGAPTAMLLARNGHRVALVDRASFPSDTISTHFLWQRGGARLQKWGLLGRLRERGCEPIHGVTFDLGPVALTGIGPPVGGVAETYCPRRTVLDKLLVDAAVEAGVELLENTAVTGLIWSGDRVCGVEVRSRDRGSLHLPARVVVGADGLHSAVARAVGAETYIFEPPLTCVYYSYWSGLASRQPLFYIRPGRVILLWPTNDDLVCIYVGWRRQELGDFRRDIERSFMRTLELVPGLREIVAGGRREQRFLGSADLPNQYRRSHGEGWALAGDAGHHKDPTTGMGMSDAFVSAELLGEALEEVLSGSRPWPEALAGYQRRRDSATENGFRLTLSTARLEPVPAHLVRFYEEVSRRPELVERVLGVLGASVPIDDVFSHEQIERALN